VPKPLDEALSKVWGYASERARHVLEGRNPNRQEAELVVGLAAAAAVAVYNHNFSGERAVCRNLLTAAGFAAVKDTSQEREDIELLAAGPPCKGFSQLRNGNHDGRNGNNRVLAAMPRYVALIGPRLFLIENVPDLVRHRRGRTLTSLLEQLRHPARGLRYVVEHRIYDAAAFGTPQARRRLLIFGVRQGFRGRARRESLGR
jgi:DNA (cytosine-5)-methyltransferase 1